jgi:hypothetical protein
MWTIMRNFQLGNEKHPTNYLVGQVVSDDEFTEEIRNTKLIPNGWIQHEPGAPQEKEKQYLSKEPYKDPE